MAMKTTQGWIWLAAGVLAAGLNASYYDGGLQWARQMAAHAGQASTAVLVLASGRAGQFLSETQQLMARNQNASCRVAATLALVQNKIARSHAGVEHFDAMTAREEAQLARLEANRARMEAQLAAQTARFRIAAANFAPLALKDMPAPVVCPRVRVNLPRLPRMKMPVAPEIHIEMAGMGPV
jgi:hypothetical protein